MLDLVDRTQVGKGPKFDRSKDITNLRIAAISRSERPDSRVGIRGSKVQLANIFVEYDGSAHRAFAPCHRLIGRVSARAMSEVALGGLRVSADQPQANRQPYRSPAPQFALLRQSFVLLVQISDPIFKLTRFLALWKARDNHVGAGRDAQASLGWPISYHLADAKFVGWHRLNVRTLR
jgi:hypothetical protein